MGHKIFVSYKYSDSNVRSITNRLYPYDTARDYVDYLIDLLKDKTSNIYKGEPTNEDLSKLKEERIWQILKDRIYDTTLTIVLISPNMKDDKPERDQWIPWEISYSLKQVKRTNNAGSIVESYTNAILAVVLPDRNDSYNYYMQQKVCCNDGCTLLSTKRLFKILQDNMFNRKNPEVRVCDHYNEIFYGDASYITSVKWDDFIQNPDFYIEKAFYLLSAIENYDVKKEIESEM